jgi:hypothetical protein
MADPADIPSWAQPEQTLDQALHRFSRALNRSPHRDYQGPTSDLEQMVIKWAPDRKLNWIMFQGIPDKQTNEDALTSADIWLTEREIDKRFLEVAFSESMDATHFETLNGQPVMVNNKPKQVSCGTKCGSQLFWSCTASAEKLKFEAVFFPGGSWVMRSMISPEDSPRVLRHEQGHFDLTHIWAETLTTAAAKLSATAYSCKKEDAAIKAQTALSQRVRELYEDHKAKWLEENQTYDEETWGSARQAAQARWEAAIRQRLGAR